MKVGGAGQDGGNRCDRASAENPEQRANVGRGRGRAVGTAGTELARRTQSSGRTWDGDGPARWEPWNRASAENPEQAGEGGPGTGQRGGNGWDRTSAGNLEQQVKVGGAGQAVGAAGTELRLVTLAGATQPSGLLPLVTLAGSTQPSGLLWRACIGPAGGGVRFRSIPRVDLLRRDRCLARFWSVAARRQFNAAELVASDSHPP
ncbi:hypothetical protein GCM10027269_15120 [Kribbella endophytica]